MIRQGLIITLILLTILSLIGLRAKLVEPSSTLREADNLELGDILFVDIYDGWCIYGYWDHIAIYVGDGRVVEATYNGGGMLTPLRAFLKRDCPAKMVVKRLKKETPGRERIIQEAVDYALAQVGKGFDHLALFTGAHKIGSRAHTCAELIWRAYKAGGVDLDSNGGIFIWPDDIYYSSKLI